MSTLYDERYRTDVLFCRIPHYDDAGAPVSVDLPTRATRYAAGYDVVACCPQGVVEIPPLTVRRIHTGWSCALPRHAMFQVCSRSGLASKGVHVINAPGIIDSDYRGEIGVLLTYIAAPDAPPFAVTHGMRIAQLLYVPPTPIQYTSRAYPLFVEVATAEELPHPDSSRTGGFGSTGI